MPPTIRFSIGVGGLEFLAEAYVQSAEQEEGERGAYVDDIVHGNLEGFSEIKVPRAAFMNS